MKKRLRILYIGELWEGSTCLERMRILGHMGHEVVPIDTTPWVASGTRVSRSLAHRLNAGPPVWRLNKALVASAGRLGSVNLIWIDKGRWLHPEALLRLREKTAGRLLHYTPDAQLVDNKSRYFNASIPLYDVLVTTKPFEVDLYFNHGARRVVVVLQGHDGRFVPVTPSLDERAKFESDVSFVGQCQRHYAQRLRAVQRTDARLRIWGPRWSRYARFHQWARPYVAGEGIWGVHYPRALACTKIALGLLSKRIPETTTTRTFEIPATGVFMLAERTEEHLALFQEGVEAEFFESDEELQDKVKFYLKHKDTRAKIAAAGWERCVRSGYHSECQLSKVLAQIS